MESVSLMFGSQKLGVIHSLEELSDALIKIRSSFTPPNPILELKHSSNNALILCLSNEGCALGFYEPMGPTSYLSIGDRTLSKKDRQLKFRLDNIGQYSELSRRHMVSFEQILKAAQEFYMTGKKPELSVDWEID